MMYHSAIFYPDDKDELLSLICPIDEEETIRGAILPHMDLRRAAPFYSKVFGGIKDGKRIVLLLPLHRPPLERDKDQFLFSPKDGIEETILGKSKIVGCGFTDSSAYEKEEYSREILLQYTSFHNPSSEILIIFTYICSSSQMKELTRFLSSLNDGNTVFIVSSNMTGRLPEHEMLRAKNESIANILSQEHLMDLYQKRRITCCGAPLIECVRNVLKGEWTLVGSSQDDKSCGHACFVMR